MLEETSVIFVRKIMELNFEVMEREIEKIKDFDGFDPSSKGQILGIQKMSKALHDELQKRGF
tara:strand:- start:488 stop:673 length:186 start_codon:yes stop_codon:yes gene_type:complete